MQRNMGQLFCRRCVAVTRFSTRDPTPPYELECLECGYTYPRTVTVEAVDGRVVARPSVGHDEIVRARSREAAALELGVFRAGFRVRRVPGS